MIKHQAEDVIESLSKDMKVIASAAIDIITPDFIKRLRTKVKNKARIKEEEEYV
jgi:hypothetical protein